MLTHPFRLLSAMICPVAITCGLIHYYKSRIKAVAKTENSLNNTYYNCIFLTMENMECRNHLITWAECGPKCSLCYLRALKVLIKSAKTSILMCMYHLTLQELSEELQKAQERGVEVRIITDCVTSKLDHSKMKALREKFGFDVKSSASSDALMHHKFCLIDAESAGLRKMFAGSLNLTLQGFAANFEDVVVTNNEFWIGAYKREFEILWRTL